MAVMTSGAAPCVECGTTGGTAAREAKQPRRRRGLCDRCYQHPINHGSPHTHPKNTAYPDGTFSPHPEPWPHLNNVTATGRMLWKGRDGKRQKHAIFAYHFDARAEIAEARHDAARWLMEHPTADLLDWPDPSLSLFGAANRKQEAA